MKPIYEPRGAAKEYGDYALNIYTGCPHRCFYCFAPGVLRRDKETFHSVVQPRENIVEETRKQLEREKITGKLIHLCFTCDPYPTGYDSTTTREIIKLLWSFENWSMSVENAEFEYVIPEEELASQYRSLPAEYRTCRMFRWAVWHYKDRVDQFKAIPSLCAK